jgi:hypothetical protein
MWRVPGRRRRWAGWRCLLRPACLLLLALLALPERSPAQDDGETSEGVARRAIGWIERNPGRILDALASQGVHPKAGSFAYGSGVSLGVSYWQPKVAGSPFGVFGSWATSLGGDQLQQLRLGKIPHASGRIPSRGQVLDGLAPFDQEDGGLFYFWEVRNRDLDDVGLFTADQGRFGYDYSDLSSEAVIGYRFGDHWAASVRLGTLDTRVSLPQVLVDEEAAASLPAVGQPLDYFTISSELARDSRDRPRNPHRGSFLSLAAFRFQDREQGRYSFSRLAIDGRRYLPLGSERHVLALHLFGSWDQARAGGQVPFHMQAAMGGSSSLRGFQDYRFRGLQVVGFTGEYRFDLAPAIELAAFYDAGHVSGGLAELCAHGFASSYGVGVRLKTTDSVALRLDVARGREGVRAHLKIGLAF